MAEPGDPPASTPTRPVVDHDDLVGFSSLAALAGQSRRAAEPIVHQPMPGRTAEAQKDLEGATGLYAVYALILFAIPTLGVSALIALLAVTGRAGPSQPLAASHFVFQQRTLWAGAAAALSGGILIAVGLGVFVLFVVAVWLIVRGASGVLALKAGRAVRDPRGWFLA